MTVSGWQWSTPLVACSSRASSRQAARRIVRTCVDEVGCDCWFECSCHAALQGTLRPVDKYAVRFLEDTGPCFDVAAAAAAAAADGEGRADWDVEQIQALQEQVWF